MPKKAKPETPAEQSARFVRETEALIAAGDLSPADAEEGMERALKGSGARAGSQSP
jgi:hypothetical protein